MYDVVFAGCTVVDGSGGRSYIADVAVQGGKIAAVGTLEHAEAQRRVSGSGKVLAPGFIDMHTHSDLPLLVNNRAESKIRQGVTTEVIGNCGFGPAPLTAETKPEICGMSTFLAKGSEALGWEWLTFGEYLDAMDQNGAAVNVVPLVGHVPIRMAAMGVQRRHAEPEEIKTQQQHLRQSLEDGAFGMSSGLIFPPSSYADTEELVSLAHVLHEFDSHYFSHIRGEGDTLLRAVAEAIEIGERADVSVEIAHHKATGKNNWGKVHDATMQSERAQARNVNVNFDVYPYTAGSGGLDQVVPNWAKEGGTAAMLARLKDPETYAQLREEAAASFRTWEKFYLVWIGNEAYRQYEGQEFTAIGESLRMDPLDAAFHLIIESRNSASMLAFSTSEDDVDFMLRHPLGMVGSDGSSLAPYGPLSQGVPHPRNYGTYPRILQVYVRERGVLTLEQAIRKMSGACAEKLGLAAKGFVRSGCDADLVLFDPQTVTDNATFGDPHQYPSGIDLVMVNGEIVVENSEHTGKLPGKVLRKN